MGSFLFSGTRDGCAGLIMEPFGPHGQTNLSQFLMKFLTDLSVEIGHDVLHSGVILKAIA
jgi:hypothetical protein